MRAYSFVKVGDGAFDLYEPVEALFGICRKDLYQSTDVLASYCYGLESEVDIEKSSNARGSYVV